LENVSEGTTLQEDNIKMNINRTRIRGLNLIGSGYGLVADSREQNNEELGLSSM